MQARTIASLALALAMIGCDNGNGSGDGGTSPGMDAGTMMLADGRIVPVDSGSHTGTDSGHGGCVPTFEICGDHMDQNCDGHETACGNTDGDFFDACRPGEAPPACDCDDETNTVYPGAPETCNGVDDDCDGRVDEVAACCAACSGMAERADICTEAGACVCSTEGAGDAPCAAGQTCCASGCVDTQTDFMNCGACQSACTSQADTCSGGVCHCGEGPACDCDVQCVSGSCSGPGCG